MWPYCDLHLRCHDYRTWKWTVSHRKPVNGRSVFVFISSALTKGKLRKLLSTVPLQLCCAEIQAMNLQLTSLRVGWKGEDQLFISHTVRVSEALNCIERREDANECFVELGGNIVNMKTEGGVGGTQLLASVDAVLCAIICGRSVDSLSWILVINIFYEWRGWAKRPWPISEQKRAISVFVTEC